MNFLISDCYVAFYENVKGGDFVKLKAIILISLAIFAAFTSFVAYGLSIQMNERSDNLASSHNSSHATTEFVQPNGFPIDCPGGPT
jgi:hypothetical protein